MQWSELQSQEATLYERQPRGRVRCQLCAHQCLIENGEVGICGVRENRNGILVTHTYGSTLVQYVDPVEKKPLFHFHPGTMTYSIATPGCNLRCRWCQNWGLARMGPELRLSATEPAAPEQIVSSALRAGCRMVAYTFTEPTVFFEYAFDTARVAAENGLSNICVSNGFMSEQMLEAFAPYLDGVNIDLKSFRDETYQTYTGGRLEPVLQNLKACRRLGIWLEVTTLVIPDVNDDSGELRDAAQFIAQELGTDTPWHLSRFVPAAEMMSVSPTPAETLHRAREIGAHEGLEYVYLANTPGADGQRTDCPNCNRVLIRRRTYGVLENNIVGGRCPICGTLIAGVHMGER